MSAPEPSPRARLFGRAKGKALRAGQSARMDGLLPRLTIDLHALEAGPAALFQTPKTAYWLEIGFGGGEHLAHLARAHPEIGFLGVEPFLNGVAKLLGEIEAHGLENIRLLRGDAREVLAALPAGALSRVYVLYPDPWPKRRQRKRRLLDEETLAAIARALESAGEMRFATDIDDYAGWVLRRILDQDALVWGAQSAQDWGTPWPEWYSTRYEQKALREGRVPGYFTFRHCNGTLHANKKA